MLKASGRVLEAIAPRTDLRRHRQASLTDLVRERCGALALPDRDLLQAVFVRGSNIAEISRLSGRPARTLRFRVKRLLGRITGPEYAFVLRHQSRWHATRRRIAAAVFLEGRSMREASRMLSLSFHTVRRQCELIRALMDAEASESGGGRALAP